MQELIAYTAPKIICTSGRDRKVSRSSCKPVFSAMNITSIQARSRNGTLATDKSSDPIKFPSTPTQLFPSSSTADLPPTSSPCGILSPCGTRTTLRVRCGSLPHPDFLSQRQSCAPASFQQLLHRLIPIQRCTLLHSRLHHGWVECPFGEHPVHLTLEIAGPSRLVAYQAI